MEPWIAILIGAVGTWIVALMAVGDRFINWLLKPTLIVERGHFSGTVGMHPGDLHARYYLVQVTNPSRFPPAHEVQLVLTRIEKAGAAGTEILFDEIMPVAWMRRELDPHLTHTVGTAATAALFYVQQDGRLGLTPAISADGQLAAHFPLNHAGPTILWVTLQALSIESDSSKARLKIDWSGQWHDSLAGIENQCRVAIDPE
jgi:hypothetical protein